MKKLIFLSLLLGLFSLGFGQSIQLTHNENVLVQDDTLWVSDTLNTLIVFDKMEIKNIDDARINIKVKKTEIDLVEGSVNTFCFAGSCFGPDTYISPNHLTLPPNGHSFDFSGDYEPGPYSGTTTMGYTFFDESNENDSIRIIVKYMAFPLGVEDTFLNSFSISSIYPNPASDIAQIDYDLGNNYHSTKIIVYNLLGSVMEELYFEDAYGKVILNIRDFDEGIYFYNVIIDNQVMKTEKLVVKR